MIYVNIVSIILVYFWILSCNVLVNNKFEQVRGWVLEIPHL